MPYYEYVSRILLEYFICWNLKLMLMCIKSITISVLNRICLWWLCIWTFPFAGECWGSWCHEPLRLPFGAVEWGRNEKVPKRWLRHWFNSGMKAWPVSYSSCPNGIRCPISEYLPVHPLGPWTLGNSVKEYYIWLNAAVDAESAVNSPWNTSHSQKTLHCTDILSWSDWKTVELWTPVNIKRWLLNFSNERKTNELIYSEMKKKKMKIKWNLQLATAFQWFWFLFFANF